MPVLGVRQMLTYQGLPVYVTQGMEGQFQPVFSVIVHVVVAQEQGPMLV